MTAEPEQLELPLEFEAAKVPVLEDAPLTLSNLTVLYRAILLFPSRFTPDAIQEALRWSTLNIQDRKEVIKDVKKKIKEAQDG